jgi:uncharacterized protein
MRLEGATVIVTGASAGIGRETALEFARRGANVVVAARRGDRLDELAARIRRIGVEALAVQADLGRGDEVRRVVREAIDRFGRVDVLVNNAGFGFSGRIEDMREEDMREMLDVNFMSAFIATQEVLPNMRSRRCGHVVNVSSMNGKFAFPFQGGYAATKAATVGFTEALRSELTDSGVTASVVLPLSTRTDFFDAQRTPDGGLSTSTGPQQSPERVARAIVRSVSRPTPEVNPFPPVRIVYGLHGFFPVLRDIAGREFFRRNGGRPRRRPAPAVEARAVSRG